MTLQYDYIDTKLTEDKREYGIDDKDYSKALSSKQKYLLEVDAGKW